MQVLDKSSNSYSHSSLLSAISPSSENHKSYTYINFAMILKETWLTSKTFAIPRVVSLSTQTDLVGAD